MATPAPPTEDLESVFGGEEAATDMDPNAPDPDEMVDEEALDMAIDEMFDAEDPAVRREAFKNAVRLCGHY